MGWLNLIVKKQDDIENATKTALIIRYNLRKVDFKNVRCRKGLSDGEGFLCSVWRRC